MSYVWSLKDIERQARTLSIDESAALAETLLKSRHVPLSDIASAWESEIEARVSAFECCEIPAYSAEDVFAEVRRLSQGGACGSLLSRGVNSWTQ